MLIKLKKIEKNDDLNLFIREKTYSFQSFVRKYISHYPQDFYLNKDSFYSIEDLKIYKDKEVFNQYKQDLHDTFKYIKSLKQLDYDKLIYFKNNNIYKDKNHSNYNDKFYHQNYTWYKIQFLIIFIDLLNKGYLPINHRVFYEENKHIHVIYYM